MNALAATLLLLHVVLGGARFAGHDAKGWGTEQPVEIFNGGDPSGLVTHIVWSDWGAPVARGHGLGWINKPGGGYWDQPVRVELRADGLGRCSAKGPPAYTRLWVRVPSKPGGPLGPWTAWAAARSIC